MSGILVKIPGNCEVFVFPDISNYVFDNLWNLLLIRLTIMLAIGSEET